MFRHSSSSYPVYSAHRQLCFIIEWGKYYQYKYTTMMQWKGKRKMVHTLMFEPSSGCSSSLPVGHTEILSITRCFLCSLFLQALNHQLKMWKICKYMLELSMSCDQIYLRRANTLASRYRIKSFLFPYHNNRQTSGFMSSSIHLLFPWAKYIEYDGHIAYILIEVHQWQWMISERKALDYQNLGPDSLTIYGV